MPHSPKSLKDLNELFCWFLIFLLWMDNNLAIQAKSASGSVLLYVIYSNANVPFIQLSLWYWSNVVVLLSLHLSVSNIEDSAYVWLQVCLVSPLLDNRPIGWILDRFHSILKGCLGFFRISTQSQLIQNCWYFDTFQMVIFTLDLTLATNYIQHFCFIRHV